jgi:imidazoleglycerol-phosphate dehydratase
LNIGYDRLSEEKLGFRVLSAGRDCVEWERRTTETYIKCKIESGLRREWRINTGINFFNHMIEMLAYYSEFNIDLEVESSRYKLLHTIIEDSGITLGKAFYLLALERIKEYGVRGFGFGRCILDEAYSEARISFEGRVGCWMMRNLESEKFMFVEDIHEESIKAFFEGFTQGMRVIIHIELLRGKDPHHLWESVFRSFGENFRQALTKNEWRKGSVAGVEKTVD